MTTQTQPSGKVATEQRPAALAPTIVIIGNGHVGRTMRTIFPDAVVYDKHQPEHADQSAVLGAELALVCVPTPQKQAVIDGELSDGGADISAVREVCGWLDAAVICIKSTVPPGTTDALRAETGKRIVFSPEYIGEGPTWDAESQAAPWPYMIVGGPQPDAVPVVRAFRATLGTEINYRLTDARTAELVKYMENVWLAQQVTFANEFYDIARAVGADWDQAIRLWALDPRVSATHTLVFEHERGYGGKCLPKDVAAIIACAEEAGYEPTFLRAMQDANARFRA